MLHFKSFLRKNRSWMPLILNIWWRCLCIITIWFQARRAVVCSGWVALQNGWTDGARWGLYNVGLWWETYILYKFAPTAGCMWVRTTHKKNLNFVFIQLLSTNSPDFWNKWSWWRALYKYHVGATWAKIGWMEKKSTSFSRAYIWPCG